MAGAWAELHRSRIETRLELDAANLADRIASFRDSLGIWVRQPELSTLLEQAHSDPTGVASARLRALAEHFFRSHEGILDLRIHVSVGKGELDIGRPLLVLRRGVEADEVQSFERESDRGAAVRVAALVREIAPASARQVVLDDVRLARWRGRIQTPWIASLQGLAPILESEAGELQNPVGALVVTLDLSESFGARPPNAAQGGVRYIVNERGDYLAHPEPGKVFGFEFGHSRKCQSDWVGVGDALSALPGSPALSSFETRTPEGSARGLMARVRFDPDRPERFLGLLQLVSDSEAALLGRGPLYGGLAAIGALACVLLAGIGWGVRRFAGCLEALRQALDETDGPSVEAAVASWMPPELTAIGYKTQKVLACLADQRELLHESEVRMRGVTETRSVGIVTIDACGVVQSANATVADLFGRQLEELVGRNISALMPPKEAREHDGYLAQYFETGVSSVIGRGREVEGLHVDGTRIPLLLSVGRFEIRGRTYFTGILREIGELKAKERALEQANSRLQAQAELQSNVAVLASMAQEAGALDELARKTLREVMRVTSADAGAFHLVEEDGIVTLASWAFDAARGPRRRFELREGLVGQCVAEGQPLRVDECPRHYFRIGSGLGSAEPLRLLFVPIAWRGRTVGVLEMASFERIDSDFGRYLEHACGVLGSAIHSGVLRDAQQHLLVETQKQARTLQQKQRELSVANAELGAQADELRGSREELQEVNRALAEQAETVERERELLARQNAELDLARGKLEERAEVLAAASRYKSEFLANMSHELRTPLNSSLILAQLLSDNPDGNLTEPQVEFARTILAAGRDLLRLIDDILDLAKVEAGKLSFEVSSVSVAAVVRDVERVFAPLAAQGNLSFSVERDSEHVSHIYTDGNRLSQILRNLLGNAFKFSMEGSISLRVCGPEACPEGAAIGFAVSDTGCGVPEDQLDEIFEAFKQLDGSSSRCYGGAGLGLSISRELAHALGGEIRVESRLGVGSTFALYLPEAAPEALGSAAPGLGNVVLGASSDESSGRPGIVSARLDAVPPRVLLVEHDDEKRREIASLLRRLAIELQVVEVSSSNEAQACLAERRVGACIVELGLPDSSAFELIEGICTGEVDTSVLMLYTGIELDRDQIGKLARVAQHSRVRAICAPDRLASELGRELRVGIGDALANRDGKSELDVSSWEIATGREDFSGRCVLLVDDDMRNVFALSEVLERTGIEVVPAANGSDALAKLESHPRIDLVLLDVMMPVMDGFEATRRIRMNPRFRDLPVVALTAKAMKGDRERCLDEGANDYLPKPVDVGCLLETLRRWLVP